MFKAQEFTYRSEHKYPGMRPKDVAIWDEFIINNPNAFERVWYNVALGNPATTSEEHKRMVDTGMYGVSQWRIDVVALKAMHFYVIEVKPNAMAGALGQALAYSHMVVRDYGVDVPVHPVVLTDDIAPITLEAANLLGVALLTP